MAAIRVQSVDDIVRAYLETLNAGKEKQKTAALSQMLGELLDNKDSKDVVSEIDLLLLKKARRIFQKFQGSDEQLLALYKFCFLKAGGLKKWQDNLFSEKYSSRFAAALKKEVPVNAPPYVLSKMEAQKIESLAPKNFWQKIIHHKGKTDAGKSPHD